MLLYTLEAPGQYPNYMEKKEKYLPEPPSYIELCLNSQESKTHKLRNQIILLLLFVNEKYVVSTIMALNIGTDRPEQTV